jgi:hypothetical protein
MEDMEDEALSAARKDIDNYTCQLSGGMHPVPYLILNTTECHKNMIESATVQHSTNLSRRCKKV